MSTLPSDILDYPFDADLLVRKKRAVKRQLLARDVKWTDKRIAILGGSTTNDIQDILELFLLKEGIRPSFWASEYNKFWEDAMFGNPELEAFAPDVIFIHTTSKNILRWPSVSMTAEQVDELLGEQFDRFRMMWEKLSLAYSCPIIQNNFDRPPYRLLGNKDVSDFRGHSNFAFRMNGLLYDYANTHQNFYVHDIDYLCAQYGQSRWQDPQYWDMYKYALNLKAIPEFSSNLANIIKSIYGKNKKVITVDLDNTLWGGVVGDDGVENLILGSETPSGEKFIRFQKYLSEIKQLGVLLAVNSKNDESNALAGLNHPESLLHPDDFAHIEANWTSKDVNMQSIAQVLNLGLDSFVFVDDNPAEQSIVQSQVSAVTVIGGETPYDFCERLDRGGFFEVTNLTADDLVRNEMYRANANRVKLQKSFENYEDYLRSLEMRAAIRDFEPVNLQRIAQLTNKTNQFNLTTKRFSDADIEQIAADDDYIRLCGRLEDKFGDNGIVSVVVGKAEGNSLNIVLWLMSCRVLKRDFELAMFDALTERCRERGITQIIGYYYPTAKNKMVKDFYGELGFEKVSEDADGNTVWSYSTEGREIKNHVIEVIN